MPSELTELASKLRGEHRQPSRAACWRCGLPEKATCHVLTAGVWWVFHEYEPAILTRIRGEEQ